MCVYSGVRLAEDKLQSGLDMPGFSVSSRPRRPRASVVPGPDTASPMVARRANVIQEWNRLQRSHSKSGRERPTEPARVSDKVNRFPGIAIILASRIVAL